MTIPKKVRQITHFEENEIVTIIPIGDSIIITPRKLELEEARRQIKKIVKKSGTSMEKIFASLKEERDVLYKERYGKKAD
jgi:bifunctional DNA-binding transcriptional regulator/antitoxin component of YhaV-PrlF toxin-antitoxin module